VCPHPKPFSPSNNFAFEKSQHLFNKRHKAFFLKSPDTQQHLLIATMMGQEATSDETPSHTSTDNTKEFVSSLEKRLRSKSDKIEELHMEAAIDAEFSGMDKAGDKGGGDSGNPNSVANCLSPYVPTKAERIAAFVSWVGLKGETSHGLGDFLLDIGCGDGRVCTSATKLSGKFEYLDGILRLFYVWPKLETIN
jgi:hypothetical protein